jgi:hypothetical protein
VSKINARKCDVCGDIKPVEEIVGLRGQLYYADNTPGAALEMDVCTTKCIKKGKLVDLLPTGPIPGYVPEEAPVGN